MATKKYISLSNLTSFLNNLKNMFATKTEVNNKSDKTHTHSISDITNLQTTLNNKASTSHGTHVSYSTTSPVMDGTASAGSASTVARSDHKHPTDTSRAAQTSLDSHTSNTTSHITSTERTNWNTAYNHSQAAHAPSNAEPNQNAFSNVKVGDVTIAADIKTDTLTLVAGNNITITPDATNDKITITAKDTTYTLGSFGVTATAAELNKLDGVTATATEINYIDGVTSNIQTQLDSKAASGHTHNYAGSSSAGGAATSANKLNTNNGSATQPVYFSNGVPVATTYTLGKSVPSNAVFTDTHYSSKNVVGATNATSNTATALTNGNVYINSVENGAVTSSHKISGSGATTVTTDTSGNIVISSTDNNTTYSAAGSALGLVKTGGDVTISSGVITVNDDSHNHTIANIDNLQTSLDGKQATINGGASTITSSNLTTNRALISNGSGKVAVSAVTSTELGYLDGVTSNVQTQLDGKSGTSHTHSYAGSSSVGGSATSAVKLATARTISLIGDATGSTTFDGSGNVSITTTVADDSHNHTIANVDNLQTTLDSKSYFSSLHKISAGDSNTHYYKLITITPTAKSYQDMYYEFDVAARSNKYATIRIFVITTNNEKYISSAYVTYDGSLGANFTAYKYRDTTNLVDRIEIWGKVTSWDEWQIFPKTYMSEANISFTWNKTEGTALPTNATETINVTAHGVSGNAATATNVAWSGVTSKPSYYDAKAIKGITRNGTTFTYTCMDGTTGTFTQQDNNTTYSVATTSANGLMSSTDKSKLDGIASGANKYTHPSYTARTGVPTANATLTHGGTFTVTQPVCDATGHITALNTRTYTLPSDNNTDTKVTNTLATTTKAYVTGTTSATTSTGTQVFDTGVYLDTTAGQLTATTFNGTTFKGSGVATVAEVETYLGI